MKQFFLDFLAWKQELFAEWRAKSRQEWKEEIIELGWVLLATSIYGAIILGFYFVLKLAFA